MGQLLAGRYQILSKIGEGGMGQVYLAEHVRIGRKSAVKVMRPQLAADTDAASRFVREATNASKATHPHIAAIYDFGETDDHLLYLAMEFVEGDSLKKVIERGPVSQARAATIIRQSSEALAAAHRVGIVHRDLKPDNIMVSNDPEGGDWVKLLDFGIAKIIENKDQKVTRTGMSLGTPAYMSPEQIAGDVVDWRSDIYSLALVAFTVLTGELPYPDVTSRESMIMRLTEPPRRLAQVRPEIGWAPQLQQVMDKALAGDPKERHQSAVEFGREFVAGMSGADQSTSMIDTRGVRSAANSPDSRVSTADAITFKRPLIIAGSVIVLAGAAIGILKVWPGAEITAAPLANIGAPAEGIRGRGDSTVTTGQPPQVASTPATSATPVPPKAVNLSGILGAIDQEVKDAKTDVEAGRYATADIVYARALKRLDSLTVRYPGQTSSIAPLRGRAKQQRDDAERKCAAEVQVAKNVGDTPPLCH